MRNLFGNLKYKIKIQTPHLQSPWLTLTKINFKTFDQPSETITEIGIALKHQSTFFFFVLHFIIFNLGQSIKYVSRPKKRSSAKLFRVNKI